MTVSELAAIFRGWLDVCQRMLEPEVYFRIVPELRKATTARPIPQIQETVRNNPSH